MGLRVGGTTASLNRTPIALLALCPDEALKLWPVNRQKIGNVRNKERDAAKLEQQAI